MRREILLIGEMIDAAEQAQRLIMGIDVDALAEDRQRRDALLWNYTVMGEAAAQLTDEVKARFPEIPWAQPSRLRNRVIHGYRSIDLEILHTTAEDQLPQFADQLRAALTELEAKTDSSCVAPPGHASTAGSAARRRRQGCVGSRGARARVRDLGAGGLRHRH